MFYLLIYLLKCENYHLYCSLESYGSYVVSLPELEPFIEFLQKLSDMGAAMKAIITGAMLDPNVYEKLQSTVSICIILVMTLLVI